ncbi:carbohydrate ABC transporter permease [Stackebrandtia nassauensis]|uniref:Binding-protein-dependent transport systems inner membrane component n=1 Tax=Stackebrandtia nassauensis (strain DSM 44728 / CIP 108903 / NRRL B-16338 / NBRC 102104 / LLR-40K-21) TaxID=446470 RepID=D3PV62_STANL|nr:carbohydrate ABC transporter permease [Stackebrandtia nassauensis]ADD41115.1 binding-protein-dependent transport systems inner membrane component [Stackebrandtia nassauensis DSM 44728]
MTTKPAAGHDEARQVARKVAARIGFYVASCLIAVFFALPLLWLISAPFDSSPGFAVGFPEFTLSNFATLANNRYAMSSLVNSILLAAGTTVFVVVGAALASYALSRVRIPGRDALLYILLLLSSVVTGTAAMVPLYLLISEIGAGVHPSLGIDSRFAVMLVMAGGLLPAAIFMLKDFIDTIPKSYEESARVFGASPLRTLKDVVAPLIAPGLATITVWSVVNVWGNFLVPFILLRDPEKQPGAVLMQTMYTEAGQPNLALLGAFSLVYSLPVVVLYLFVARRYGFRFHGGIKS